LWNLNAHCADATVELLQKETLEFIQPQLWPPNSPDLNPVDNSMLEILQEKVCKTRITALGLSTTPLTNGFRSDDRAQLLGLIGHSLRSRCFSSSRSVTQRMFCTLSLAVVLACCNQLDSNLANLEATVDWGGMNSDVSFCNNSRVARVRWAFQVSQSGVETLFRWGGKRLHQFEANLFKTRCTKFHQNRPSFIEDITENKHVGLFFWTHCIHIKIHRPVVG